MSKTRDYAQRVAWAVERGAAAEKALQEKRKTRLAGIHDLPEPIQKLIAGQDMHHRRLYGRDLSDENWHHLVRNMRTLLERKKQ